MAFCPSASGGGPPAGLSTTPGYFSWRVASAACGERFSYAVADCSRAVMLKALEEGRAVSVGDVTLPEINCAPCASNGLNDALRATLGRGRTPRDWETWRCLRRRSLKRTCRDDPLRWVRRGCLTTSTVGVDAFAPKEGSAIPTYPTNATTHDTVHTTSSRKECFIPPSLPVDVSLRTLSRDASGA